MPTSPKKTKLTGYVDGSGHHAASAWFVVALVLIKNEEREALQRRLQEIEGRSGKSKKWRKTTKAKRRAYIQAIVQSFPPGKVFYLARPQERVGDHKAFWIDTVVRALVRHAPPAYEITLFSDDINKEEQENIRTELRRQGIAVRKVRRLSDQKDEFIRLADAVAGFVRSALEGLEFVPLFQQARQRGVLEPLE